MKARATKWPAARHVRFRDGWQLLAMILLWGLSWPAMKLCLGHVPPLWLATLRFAGAGSVLLAFLAWQGHLRVPPREDWPIVASIGGLQMMAFTALVLLAMREADAGRAALLAYTTPVWVLLGGMLLFRQRPSRAEVASIPLGLGGVAAICSPGTMDWQDAGVLHATALLLLAALCWSVVILHVRHHRWKATPLSLAPWQMLMAALPLGITAVLVEGEPTGLYAWEPWPLLVFIGPVATSACFVISASLGRRLGPITLSNATLGVPAVGLASSVLLLGEALEPGVLTGLVLLVMAVATAGLTARGRP